MPGTRKLGRPTDHRMSMLKGMVTYLLEKGQIETTYQRAKEVSALTDKMVTLGKENTLASKRKAMSFLKKEAVVYKLFTLIAPLYDDRQGGYTRVLKTGPRRGDGAEMAIIMMVDADAVYNPQTKKEAAKAEKETAKAEKKSKKTNSGAAEVIEAADEKPAAKKTIKKSTKTVADDVPAVEETPVAEEAAAEEIPAVEPEAVEEAPVAEAEAAVEETTEAATDAPESAE